MDNNDLHQRQFFNPHIFYSGGSEHELRFPDVSNLEYLPGKKAFQSLCPSETEDNKLLAVESLRKFLSNLKEQDAAVQEFYLPQLLLALKIKKHHFVEDTTRVCEALAELLVDTFKMASQLEEKGLSPYNDQDRIVSHLVEVAGRDYEANYPDSLGLPNMRADQLILRLSEANPSMLDVSRVDDWCIYKRVPRRLGVTLKYNGKPYTL